MALLVVTDSITTTWIYVFALLSGVAAAIDSPARQAILGDVVGQENLVNGVALNSVAFNISRILGPAIAGVLIALWGTSEVFVITAILFGLSLVLLAKMKSITHPRDHATTRGNTKPTLGQGLRFVGSDSTMLFCMLAVFIVATFNLNFQLTTALMSTVEFGGDAAAFGILTTVLALGSLLGSLLAARRKNVRIRLVVAAAVIHGRVLRGNTCWRAPHWLGLRSLRPKNWSDRRWRTECGRHSHFGDVAYAEDATAYECDMSELRASSLS
jgi:MFS family permease